MWSSLIPTQATHSASKILVKTRTPSGTNEGTIFSADVCRMSKTTSYRIACLPPALWRQGAVSICEEEGRGESAARKACGAWLKLSQ